MLPREAVRPLYRAAVAARGRGGEAPKDPLEVLVAYCATLLPLPPFAVWSADFRRSPDAYLRDLGESVEGPTAATPVTLASRTLQLGGSAWTAGLHAFRADAAWRGYVAFDEPSTGHACRTAVIFRESTPEELKESFAAFDAAALEAFLRSALP